jgi:hypothetical protein
LPSIVTLPRARMCWWLCAKLGYRCKTRRSAAAPVPVQLPSPPSLPSQRRAYGHQGPSATNNATPRYTCRWIDLHCLRGPCTLLLCRERSLQNKAVLHIASQASGPPRYMNGSSQGSPIASDVEGTDEGLWVGASLPALSVSLSLCCHSLTLWDVRTLEMK